MTPSARRCLTGVLAAAVLAGLVGCQGQACRCARDTAAQGDVLRPRDDIAGLPNFAKVSGDLYRGAQPTAEGFRALAAMGVRTVVNLRSDHSDGKLLAGTGLRCIDIGANALAIGDDEAEAFLRVMRDRSNLPVFVHCRYGADRTGLMVAAYRMTEQGWSNKQAAAEMRRFGFHRVWVNISRAVDRFDADAMRQRLATPAAE